MKKILFFYALVFACPSWLFAVNIKSAKYLNQTTKFLKHFAKVPANKQFFISGPLNKYNNEFFEFINEIIIRPEPCPSDFFRNLMKKNRFAKEKPSDSYIIPPIIHQIWVGPRSKQRFEKLRQTWINNHPGWLYMLWTDKEVKKLHLVNRDMYDKATNYGEKADILRYELLYLFGGVYIDIDEECVKPLDIIHRCFDFYGGICRPDLIANGIIGASPRHLILRRVIETIPNNKRMTSVPHKTGPFHFTNIVKQMAISFPNMMIFPSSYFYPEVKVHMKKTTADYIEGAEVLPETFGIQGWAGSWLIGIK